MKNVMIDLETYGTNPHAAIVSIGAVAFDFSTMKLGDTFYVNIDLQSAIDAGGVVDEDTVRWWSTQKQEAKDALNVDPQQIRHALAKFTEYMNSQSPKKDVLVWGNGSDFDNVILSSAYRRLDLPLPWGKYNNRCYRTIKGLYPSIKQEKVGVKHNALDDAVAQAKHLVAMLNPWSAGKITLPV